MQRSLFDQEQDSSPDDRTNILLSLQNDYFQKMINGRKKYEYRFVFPKSKVRAYIYVPRKVKAIRGYVDLEKPIVGTAEEISTLYADCGDGSYESMFEYIGKKKKFYAMKVEQAAVFETPLEYSVLKQAFPDFHAPQSYIILDKKLALLKYIAESGK